MGRRRSLLFGGAALLLFGAGGGTVVFQQQAALRLAAWHRLQSKAATTAAAAALKARRSQVEGEAVAAASLSVLRAQLGVVDAATLLDGFKTEPWWRSVREAFPVYGVALADRFDVLVGVQEDQLELAGLLEEAREKGKASSVALAGHQPLLVAGALVVRAGLRPVVLVGAPLDGALLEQLAGERGAALLTDGKSTLLSGGPAPQVAQLAAARGREKAGTFAGEGWAAGAMELAPGLWLWVRGSPTADAPEGALPLAALWAVAGAAAVALTALGLRRPQRPDPAAEGQVEAAAPVVPKSRPVTGSGRPAPKLKQTNPGSRSTDPNPGAAHLAVTGVDLHPGAAASDPGRAARPPRGGVPIRAGGTEKGAPQRFGRYWLIDRLGEGGMAEVYLAVAFGEQNFRRNFVLKRLRGEGLHNQALVNMFIDEARLASGLVHGNIIPVFDFGREGEEYFIAQEYILGRDLRRVTSRAIERDQRPLDPRFLVFALRETLRALDYAHHATGEGGRQLGLVHRDVSPNNILVSGQGEVKLFDFGIAKSDEGRLTQTQMGVVKGNVQFMSEEQARGEPVDARADLASLGLVFFYALTGQALYAGETSYVMLVKAATGLTPEMAARIEAKLPPEYASIVSRAIAPRDQRFQNASEFEQALAGLPAASGSELRREMERLFGADLRAEEARLGTVVLPAQGGEVASDEAATTLENEPVPREEH